eukprot:15339467-Ditylum_brightwellii.AAC.2
MRKTTSHEVQLHEIDASSFSVWLPFLYDGVLTSVQRDTACAFCIAAVQANNQDLKKESLAHANTAAVFEAFVHHLLFCELQLDSVIELFQLDSDIPEMLIFGASLRWHKANYDHNS